MAYQFPLNGGRINASVGGNSTSAGAGYQLVSTGTLLLAGGNNVTLSQNGSAITISGANVPSGSINFSAGTTSGNLNSIRFSNSNGVSFGLNGSTLTASVNTSYAASNHSHGNPTLNLTNLSGTTASASNGLTLSLSAASQSAQTIGGYASGNTTGQSSSTTFDARSLSISATGGVSAGYSAGMLQMSAPAISSLSQTGIVSISRNGNTISIGAPAFSAGMSTLGNTTGTSGTVSNRLIFAGGNNITLSQSTGASGNTISISAPNQTAYSFANSNGVSFGTNGSTVTASVAGGGGGGVAVANSQTTYTSGTANFVGSGAVSVNSTTGQSLVISAPAQSNLSATGAVSISNNGNTISIGAPAFSAGISSNSTVTNRLILAAGANISLSQSTNASGATVSIAGGAGGGGGGIALANSQTTYTSGTAQLNASGAMTIASTTGQQFNLSVPATSMLSAGNGISISTTGSTVVFQGANVAQTLSYFNPQDAYPLAAGQHGQGTLHFQPFQAPNVQYDRVVLPMVHSNATNSSGSQTVSFWVGIYSRSSDSLSLASSTSASFALTQSGTQGNYSLYGGQRLVTIGSTNTISQGQYYVGIISRSTSGGANASFSQLVASQINSNFSGVFGAASNASIQQTRGLGYYSASTTAFPSSVAFSEIRGTASMALRQPAIYLLSQTF